MAKTDHRDLPGRPGYFQAYAACSANMVGEKLRAARKASGMTLSELSEALREYGVLIKTPSVNHWETGETVPNAYQLLALCHALGISGGLAYFTGSVTAGRRDPLNAEGQRMLKSYREFLESRPQYTEATRLKMVEMPVSTLSASAGYGDFLEEGSFELCSFPARSVPEGADFALRVHGDSMEPLYQNGQLVWIRSCTTLAPGDVGLFVVDGEGFIKTYDERTPDPEDAEQYLDSDGVLHPQVVLLSQNPNYPPRFIRADNAFRIRGRVLR